MPDALPIDARESLLTLAGKRQQQLEHIDEIQVKGERAEDGELLLRFMGEVLGVLLFD